MPTAELAQPIPAARWPSLHGFIVEMTAHVLRQRGGRLVAPRSVLLQTLENDPIQLAPLPGGQGGVQLARAGVRAARTGGWRFFLTNGLEDLNDRRLPDPAPLERGVTRQQFV